MRWTSVFLLACLLVGAHAEQRTEGFFSSIGKGIGIGMGKLTKTITGAKPDLPGATGAAAKIKPGDANCVVCQYLVERIKGEMLMNGINGGVPFTPSQDGMVGVPSAGGAAVQNPATLFTPPPTTGEAGGNAGNAGNTAATNVAGSESSGVFLEEAAQVQYGDAELGKMVSQGVHMATRDRKLMLRHFEPPQIRYADMYDGPKRAEKRAQERFEDTEIQTVVYKSLEKICERQMPQPFYNTCFMIIQQYEQIAESLKWNDRPGAVCMHINVCPKTSYLAQGPHEVVRGSVLNK